MFHRLIGDRATMSNAEASDIVLRHPAVQRSQRVFITRTHGGKILEQVKVLAASGRFVPVVARERGAADGSLLYDLVEQMRGCDTAIIHVTAGLASPDADREPQISGDVLIEIGAAMALYGREFVLLVEDAIALPPYLHGLRECRYSGEALNVAATMRLLRTFGSSAQPPSGYPSTVPHTGSVSAYAEQAHEAAAKH
jgi:Predicted nucleotide-binding protein containing TIR-like domain